MKIQNIIGIDGYTLLIYCSLDQLYSFSIIDFSGIAFNFDSIFLTAEEANVKGRAAVEIARDFDRNLKQVMRPSAPELFWQQHFADPGLDSLDGD